MTLPTQWREVTPEWFYEPFVKAFQAMQQNAADINRKNGFVEQEKLLQELESHLRWEGLSQFNPILAMFQDARVGLKLALVVGEIGEALEAVRKNKGADDHIPAFTAEEAEIADAVIRLMNYATDRNLRLAEAIAAKNEFNRNRADHTQEARAGEHGKRF